MDYIRVLHVEDNARIAEIVKDILFLQGIEVVVRTTSLEDTKIALRDFEFDVIIVDMCLFEDEDAGNKIISYIFEFTEHRRIVVFSDIQKPNLIRKSVEYGAVRYVYKTNLNMLHLIIRDLMHENNTQTIIADAYRERLIREKLTETENHLIDVYQRVDSVKVLATEMKMSEDTIKRSFRTIRNKLKIDIKTIIKKFIRK